MRATRVVLTMLDAASKNDNSPRRKKGFGGLPGRANQGLLSQPSIRKATLVSYLLHDNVRRCVNGLHRSICRPFCMVR